MTIFVRRHALGGDDEYIVDPIDDVSKLDRGLLLSGDT